MLAALDVVVTLPLASNVPQRVLLGCDFSSAPHRRKPIVVAHGRLIGKRVQLLKLERFETLAGFAQALKSMSKASDTCPHGWLGVFDLPFGLPRELVTTLGWPLDWLDCIQHYCALSREEIRTQFRSFCAARPIGGKFAHRVTDGPAGSSPSMKWVNPPVAFMLHAGLPLILDTGASLPGLHVGTSACVALEGYPGLLAREVLGRTSYKSDDRKAQTPERLIARKDLITALEHGHTRLNVALKLTHAQRDALADDATGDSLDAVLCLLQAAWAQSRLQDGDACYGLPPDADPLEGWIVTA